MNKSLTLQPLSLVGAAQVGYPSLLPALMHVLGWGWGTNIKAAISLWTQPNFLNQATLFGTGDFFWGGQGGQQYSGTLSTIYLGGQE